MRLSVRLAQMAAFLRLVSCGVGWEGGWMMSTWLRAQTDGSWKALGAARKGDDVAQRIIWRSCCACTAIVHGAEAQPASSPSTWCWRRDQGYMPELINTGPSSPFSSRVCRLALSSALQCEPSLDQGIFFPSLSLTDFLCSWILLIGAASEVALMHLAALLGSVNVRLRGRRVNIGHLPILWHQITSRTR